MDRARLNVAKNGMIYWNWMTQTCKTAYQNTLKKLKSSKKLMTQHFFSFYKTSSCTSLSHPISINDTIFRNV